MSELLPQLRLLLDQLGLAEHTAPDETQWRQLLALLSQRGMGVQEMGAQAPQPGPVMALLGHLDTAGKIITWEPGGAAVLGYGPEVVGQRLGHLLTSPLEGLRAEQLISELAADLPSIQAFLRFDCLNSSHGVDRYGADSCAEGKSACLLYCTFEAVLGEHGAVTAVRFSGAHVPPEAEHRTSDQFYTALLDALPAPIALLDDERRYVFCNPVSIADPDIRAWIIGKTDSEYVAYRGLDPEIARRREAYYRQAVAEQRTTQFEEILTNRQGETVYQVRTYMPVYRADGHLLLGLGHGIEITALRKAQEALTQLNNELEARVWARTSELKRLSEQLQHDAFHDSLTGLPNRALFLDRLEQVIERAVPGEPPGYAVLFLDTDRFKRINDTLGHPAGDAMLREVGLRLRRVLRNSDTVARLGGDEFAVLLEPLPDPQRASEVAQRIQEVLCQPMKIEDYDMTVSVSIGVVLGDEAYTSAVAILRDADIAMYRAKAAGKARYRVFTPQMRRETIDQNLLENDLRRALRQGELRVMYQSIVELGDLHVTGFEALVRWQHPERGLLGPADFLGVAEESGLVLEIDRWVLNEACQQMQLWETQHPEERRLQLSVNFSGRQFVVGVADYVAEVVQRTGFDPQRLNLEITEGTLLAKPHAIADTLTQLRELGVELHLDDFGTGYSSLSYLQTYPLDTLKIDRSFVGGMLENASSAELIRTIVALAKNMKLCIVAEGIESHEQLRALQELGCDYGQGYLFSRPLPMPQARIMVDTRPWRLNH